MHFNIYPNTHKKPSNQLQLTVLPEREEGKEDVEGFLYEFEQGPENPLNIGFAIENTILQQIVSLNGSLVSARIYGLDTFTSAEVLVHGNYTIQPKVCM